VNAPARMLLKAAYSIPRPFSQLLAGREPGVLLYHGVPERSLLEGKYAFDSTAFERQIDCLKKHFDLIHPDDVFLRRSLWRRKAVVVTFDDGLRNNATVAAPILQRHGVPAIFFVCNRHITTNDVLWFSYLKALELHFSRRSFMFRGTEWDMSPAMRKQTIEKLREYLLELKPHPEAMYSAIADELPPIESFVSQRDLEEWYLGMTEEQMAQLDANALFSVESHTVDHPFLTLCEPEEAARQIRDNKQFIERACNKTVTVFSYPIGDYDQAIIDVCKELGFSSGHAVDPRVGRNPEFEVPRAGVYRPQREVAAFKAMWSRVRANRG